MTDKCGITEYCEMRIGDECTLGSPCPHQKPPTNEEWFCQLPTTEKSEFLSAMVKQAIKVYEIHGCTWHETVSWWDGWLKEKHNE